MRRFGNQTDSGRFVFVLFWSSRMRVQLWLMFAVDQINSWIGLRPELSAPLSRPISPNRWLHSVSFSFLAILCWSNRFQSESRLTKFLSSVDQARASHRRIHTSHQSCEHSTPIRSGQILFHYRNSLDFFVFERTCNCSAALDWILSLQKQMLTRPVDF